ncbi:MAG: histone deacetylase family protein [Acidimicrobiia bacterium]|nr:histone deacetylase family protein [Acidimicrobiia bacterium]MDH5519994.1 histone deacetylase family protein [Acidimicrobiia bacterium]
MDVVYSPSQTLHHALELDGGQLVLSWESPIRAVRIAERLADSHAIVEPDRFDRELAEQIHDRDYVEFLRTCWDRWVAEGRGATQAMGFTWPATGLRDVRPDSLDGQLGYYSFAADCSVGPDTWNSAAVSAAAAHTAARLVAERTERRSDQSPAAFALCRPPGHHAGPRQFGGYCYLNNAAIAAQALRNRGLGRVAVLDIDYHHGNGTQSIFYRRADVAFCSIHADPLQEYPYFAGFADETGEDDGVGHTLNLPLPLGTGPSEWMATLDRALGWVRDHEPEALVVSVGVDTFENDPISTFKLPTAVYPTIGTRLTSLDLPTVLVMEGGYATEELADNVAGLLQGFESFG